jgi:hypothetical protein
VAIERLFQPASLVYSIGILWGVVAAGLVACPPGYQSRPFIRRLLTDPRKQVTVGVHGQLDCGVPEHLGDYDDIDTGCNHQVMLTRGGGHEGARAL